MTSSIMVYVFSFLIAGVRDDPYVFIQDTNRTVCIHRGDLRLLGKLDEFGEFHQEVSFEFGPYSGPLYHGLGSNTFHPSKIYELRSGMLIPGMMRIGGRFIPEPGGEIIRFKDYQYSPNAIPIWNLPGKFVRWSRLKDALMEK